MNPDIDMDRFRLRPEDLAKFQKLPAKSPSARKPKKEIEFYQFPKPVLIVIIQSGYMPALAVAAVIHETWYKSFQRNPIILTSTHLGKFRISRGQKLRALKILEQSGYFLVKRLPRRNPSVTLKWLPIKE
jgi:hypothetical protein